MAGSMRIYRRGPIAFVALAIVLLAACSGSKEGSGAAWTQVSPSELNAMLQSREVFLVNVHVPYEGEIAGTDAFIPYDQIASRIDELPSDASMLVIYCRSGHTSTAAAEALVAAGYTGFSELTGGYTAWNAAGLPFKIKRATG
jgi:phage shock protein E